MSIDENLMNDLRLFLEALPSDLGRGSLNGMRVQLLYKVCANLQAAKPEQAQTAAGLPELDFDALARIRDEAIGELLKKLFNAAVKYAGTSGAGYSPASADAYHAAEEIKTQITSTVTAYSPTQAEIESYATTKTAEAVRELVEVLKQCRIALEPYDDIKPRDWKTDRERLRYAHQSVCDALDKYAPKKEQDNG